MSNSDRRRNTDFMKLMEKDYKVALINNKTYKFYVYFNGPPDSLYQGGVWKVKVKLPQGYPAISPTIRFITKIFHPNIDERTGAVCLDVINKAWNPVFELVNVFEFYLPQLLMQPNPGDPFNDNASTLMLTAMSNYESQVRDHVLQHAKVEDTEEENAADTGVIVDTSDSDDDALAAASVLGPIEPR